MPRDATCHPTDFWMGGMWPFLDCARRVLYPSTHVHICNAQSDHLASKTYVGATRVLVLADRPCADGYYFSMYTRFWMASIGISHTKRVLLGNTIHRSGGSRGNPYVLYCTPLWRQPIFCIKTYKLFKTFEIRPGHAL